MMIKRLIILITVKWQSFLILFRNGTEKEFALSRDCNGKSIILI